MSGRWFEGLKDAPEGAIPDVGMSGPGVKVQARDEAHAERIKATGYYKASTAPKAEDADDDQEDPTPTLAPASLTAETESSKKGGK